MSLAVGKNKFHDAEVNLIESDSELAKLKLGLITNERVKILMIFHGVLTWKLSSFEDQNVIYEVNHYPFSEVPSFLIEDYPVIQEIKSTEFELVFIDSSTGLSGIIIYKRLEIISITHDRLGL